MDSSSVSVLVNGSPIEKFKREKELRQGDPLAPFLFLIVAEGLGGLVRRAVNQELFKGYVVGEGGVQISHFEFADDTLIIGDMSIANMWTIKGILRWFELISSLKVNFFKSKLASIVVCEETVRRCARMLNCRIMSIPFTYLGIQVGANPRRLSTWVMVQNKFQKRLTLWRQKSLSFGGRICLVNSVLTSLPLFYLSLFKIPTSIANKLKIMQRNFLWGGGENVRKMSWVSWD